MIVPALFGSERQRLAVEGPYQPNAFLERLGDGPCELASRNSTRGILRPNGTDVSTVSGCFSGRFDDSTSSGSQSMPLPEYGE